MADTNISAENIEITAESVDVSNAKDGKPGDSKEDKSFKFDTKFYQHFRKMYADLVEKQNPSSPDEYLKSPLLFSAQTFAIVSRLDTITSLLRDIKKGGGGKAEDGPEEKKMKKNQKQAMDTLKMFGSIGLLVAGFAAFVFVTKIAGDIGPDKVMNAMGVIKLFYAVVVPMTILAAFLSGFAGAFIPFGIAVVLISASLLVFAYGIKKLNDWIDEKAAEQFASVIKVLAKNLAESLPWIILGAISAVFLAVFGAAMAIATITLMISALAMIGFSKLWAKDGFKSYMTMVQLPLYITQYVPEFLFGAIAAVLLAVFGVAMLVASVTLTISMAAIIGFNILYNVAKGTTESKNVLAPMSLLVLEAGLLAIPLVIATFSALNLAVFGVSMLIASTTLMLSMVAIIGVNVLYEAAKKTSGGYVMGPISLLVLETAPLLIPLALATPAAVALSVFGVAMLVATVSLKGASTAMKDIEAENFKKFTEVISGKDGIIKMVKGLPKNELKEGAKSMAHITSISKDLYKSSMYLALAVKNLSTIGDFFGKQITIDDGTGKKVTYTAALLPYMEVGKLAKYFDSKENKVGKKSLEALVDVSKDFEASSEYLRNGFTSLSKIDESVVDNFTGFMTKILTGFIAVNYMCASGAVAAFKDNIKNIADAALATVTIEEALKELPTVADGNLSDGVTKFVTYIQTNLKEMVDLADDVAAAWKKLSKTNTSDTSSALKAMNSIMTPLSELASSVKTVFENIDLGDNPENKFKSFYKVLLGRDGLAGWVADKAAGDYSILGLIQNIMKLFDLKKGDFITKLRNAGIEVTDITSATAGVKDSITKFGEVVAAVGSKDGDNPTGLIGIVKSAMDAATEAKFYDANNDGVKAISNFTTNIVPALSESLSQIGEIETPGNLNDISKFISGITSLSSISPNAGTAIENYSRSVSSLLSTFGSSNLSSVGESMKNIFDVDEKKLNYLSSTFDLIANAGKNTRDIDSLSMSIDSLAASITKLNGQVDKANVDGLDKFIGDLERMRETGPITVTLEIKDTQQHISDIKKNTDDIKDALIELKDFILTKKTETSNSSNPLPKMANPS